MFVLYALSNETNYKPDFSDQAKYLYVASWADKKQ